MPSRRVKLLLNNIISTIDPGSIIPLNEMVLAEIAVSSYAEGMGLTTMAAFTSMERSDAQWRKIFADVGLGLAQTYPYNPLSHKSVINVHFS